MRGTFVSFGFGFGVRQRSGEQPATESSIVKIRLGQSISSRVQLVEAYIDADSVWASSQGTNAEQLSTLVLGIRWTPLEPCRGTRAATFTRYFDSGSLYVESTLGATVRQSS